MNNLSQIDKLNQSTMRSAVHEYESFSDLEVSEKKVLSSIAHEIRNKRILDIGVGGGRTVSSLLELSKNYIGIDYIEEMVTACRKKYPGVRFETMDARSMPLFNDATFNLIVCAWNGICMVDHEGRMAILNEVYRLLAPGGKFVFSTYNRNSVEHDRSFTFPDFKMTSNIPKLVNRGAGFYFHTALRLRNRIRYKNQEISTPEYSIINDRCHDYKTMLYYITLDQQQKQLFQVGFKPGSRVYNLHGDKIEHDDGMLSDSLLFVAER
jgi:ubiquinone/menaquinone biosynthesis C-methylase UbiE